MRGETWRQRAAVAGAVLAALAVGAGAFGAHALRDSLDAAQLAVYETAARYQMYHALGLLVASQLPGQRPPLLRWACVLFLIGIVLFSGSLYVLAVTGRGWLGAITPFGGVAFLAGWVCVALGSVLRPTRAV